MQAGLTYDLFRSDDVDTRRELFLLLQRLPAARRMAFLGWCAARLAQGHKMLGFRVTSKSAGDDVNEVYWDVCHAMFHGLSLSDVMAKLTALARREK